ncbi:YrhB domain-containing protein [Streptomyces sp. NPDC046887]|uniref:YrhB domain-containing protein n=1 Tax=Streptomyces sp. NPDC046887 TaxID=3155472 RepID=UPI0034044499
MDRHEGFKIAEGFLQRSVMPDEPSMAIDADAVRERGGMLVLPYNSVEFLRTRRMEDMLLDCWPIIVDMATGAVRFSDITERGDFC